MLPTALSGPFLFLISKEKKKESNGSNLIIGLKLWLYMTCAPLNKTIYAYQSACWQRFLKILLCFKDLLWKCWYLLQATLAHPYCLISRSHTYSKVKLPGHPYWKHYFWKMYDVWRSICAHNGADMLKLFTYLSR